MNLDDEQKQVGVENFHAAVGNKEVREALDNLERISLFVKVLGSYPKAK